MRAPKRIYWVEVLPGGPGLSYAQKGGGKFTDLKAAKDRRSQLLRNTKVKNWGGERVPAPIESVIYQSQELEWTPVED